MPQRQFRKQRHRRALPAAVSLAGVELADELEPPAEEGVDVGGLLGDVGLESLRRALVERVCHSRILSN